MLTGTGKLYWNVVPGLKDPTFGFIRGDEEDPETAKGYAISLNDEDPLVVVTGINLKKSHSGTPVKFTARKVTSHNAYYATEVSKPI